MWTLGSLLIAVVIIAACVAIVIIATREFGVKIPPWVISILWVVLVCVVAVVAIRFLLTL